MNLGPQLDQLEQMQFVRRLNNPASSYLFKHVLVQESVYASLLLKERSQLHRAVAETLERTVEGQSDDLAVELAMHYDRAGERAKAIKFYIASGERANRISAYPEAIHAYERALELSSADAGFDRGNLMVRLGEVHSRRSEFGIAKQNFEAALTLAQEDNRATTAAIALCGLARLAGREGAHAEAQQLAEKGLEWAHRSRELKPTAQALRQLGIVRNNQGNNAMAMRDLQKALGLFRELNDPEGIATCLNSLGVVAWDERELESAVAYFQQALEISRGLGDRHSMGVRLINLGVLAQEQGDYAAAMRYHEEALAIAREVGDREGIAHANLNLGGILVRQNDFSGAIRQYRAALAESLELGSIALALYIVAGVAEVHVKLGRYHHGAQVLGFAFTHPAGTADIKVDFEPVLAILRDALPPAELELEMHRGESFDLKDVTDEILSESA